jgi:hypothetical protein
MIRRCNLNCKLPSDHAGEEPLAEPGDGEHEIPYGKPKTAVETVPDFLRKSIM